MYFREAARLADDHENALQWGDGVAQPGQLPHGRRSRRRRRGSAARPSTSSCPLRRPVRARDQCRATSSSPSRRRRLGRCRRARSPTTPTGTCSPTTSSSSRCACAGSQRYAAMPDVADELLGKVNDMLASEDPQDIAMRGHRASVRGDGAQRPCARRCAGAASPSSRSSGPCSFAGDDGRWAWPLAARCAHELGDLTAEAELLDICERHRPANSRRCSAPKRC